MKSILFFYIKILREVVKSFGEALASVSGFVSIMVFIGCLFGLSIVIDPLWGWFLLGMGVLFYTLKGIYMSYCKLEQNKDEEIADLHNVIDPVRDVKTKLLEMVDDGYSIEWQSAVRGALAILPTKYLRKFDDALCDPEPEVRAKSYLKILAARVDGTMLKEGRLEKE